MKSRSTASRLASPVAGSRKVPRKNASASRNLALLTEPGAAKRSTHRRSSEILEAAAKVFAERGYHGATTQDIADVLGIRQASLYYYFPSKEVALEVVCARSAEGFLTTAQAIAAGPGTPVERLSALIRSHISPILERGDYIKVFLTQRHFLPNPSRQRVAVVSRGIEETFYRVIREGIASGDFRSDVDPRLAMLTVLGATNTVSSWYQKEGFSLEKIAAQMVALVLNGIVVKSDPRPDGRKPKKSRR
jgi:TetR/AcrR family transcriptional regulator, cholesterol catabolism regulator